LLVRARRSTVQFAEGMRTVLYDPGTTDARVRYACGHQDAQRIRHQPPDPGTSFEPEIARVPMALGFTRRDGVLSVVGGLLGAAAAITAIFAMDLSGMGFFQSYNLWMIMGFAGTGSIALPETVFPTWVRIMPGRIDVIREDLLRRRFAEVSQHDLRTRQVFIVDGTVYLDALMSTSPAPADGPAEGPAPVAISLKLSTRRRELVRTALLAAISKAPIPELSETQLFA
jgi:hypothetical protein